MQLDFRGWRRSRLLQPGKFTELFFLDEATAFAAGHRPCALCRREDYDRFGELWRELHRGDVGADVIDARLHGERIDTATKERLLHEARLDDLPDGAFVLEAGEPWLARSGASALDARRVHGAPATARRSLHAGRRRRSSRCYGRAGRAPCRSCTPPPERTEQSLGGGIRRTSR